MRIGIDVRSLMEGKTTGVEVYLVNLLNTVFIMDKDNEYILFANSWKEISLPKFAYPNVRVMITRYPNKLFNLAQKFFKYPKVDQLIDGIDLFFSPHWRVTALSAGIPLVVTFHDLSFEIMPEFFTLRRRLWHRFMNYKRAAHRADKIIAVSERTKKDLASIYNIPEEKIKVIYSGVRPLPQSLPEAQGMGGQRSGEVENYFLYFGTFEPRKNIEAVIAAYEEYLQKSPVKRGLILAGSSGWKIKLNIPSALKKQIIIGRNLTEEDKYAIYAKAFAFIFPSFYEGFGFPVLEAASAGLPVIASFAASLREISSDFALFVNPFRPHQIASAMLELEKDEVLRADLQKKGLEAAWRFNWETSAQQTLNLFGEILNSKF